jgi:adenylyltransferase/sulfurtransferase
MAGDGGSSATDFSREELQRYSRHLILPEVGQEGQARLKAGSVLVVGAGGLGSPVALYLAAAGVGRIGIVDFDDVDMSNLQRQIIYCTDDAGKPKVVRAAERLRDLNPDIEVVEHATRLSAANALDVMREYDVVVDGTDNFGTRYLVNDACVMLSKPNVHGAIFRFDGQVSVFAAQDGPCYRCMYPSPPPAEAVPNCAEGGVLGVLAGVVGSLQATEALKLILQIGEPLIGRLLIYDALSMYFDVLNIQRNPECPVCGTNPTISELKDVTVACAVAERDVTPAVVRDKIKDAKSLLLDVRTPQEHSLAAIRGAKLIPLQELAQRMSELPDKSQEIIVYCKSGMRSAKACEMLNAAGYTNVHNMTGGITRWAKEIDPSLAVY